MHSLVQSLVRFLRELKRRKVYQVTVVYVLLAVGAMELVDILVPSTQLPEWTNPFLLSLAVVGLPLVVVLLPLCWFFLTRFAYPVRVVPFPEGRELIGA